MVSTVALMCKYLFVTGLRASQTNIFAIFCASAVVGFKLSYDTDLTGLVAEFSSRLGVTNEKIQKLEQVFLRSIDYDVNLTSKVISVVSSWFI